MPASDAHIHAFQDDLTERASRDRINQAKEHWRAYVQGRAELEMISNTGKKQEPGRIKNLVLTWPGESAACLKSY